MDKASRYDRYYSRIDRTPWTVLRWRSAAQRFSMVLSYTQARSRVLAGLLVFSLSGFSQCYSHGTYTAAHIQGHYSLWGTHILCPSLQVGRFKADMLTK